MEKRMAESGGTDKLRSALEQYGDEYTAPRRVQKYRDAALTRLEGETDGDAIDALKWLITWADDAAVALQADDTDRFAQSFERVLRQAIDLGLPAVEKAHRREWASKAGKASRRPYGPLRKLLVKVCKEIGSTDNRAVFGYWKKFASPSATAFAPEGTCSREHEMYAAPPSYHDPDAPFSDTVPDNEYQFGYDYGLEAHEATAQQIRNTLHQIRKSA
jgi:hypothetical protein